MQQKRGGSIPSDAELDTGRPSSRSVSTPQLIQSAVFGVFFIAAVFLTVLGTLYAFSNNEARSEQAYPILLFNLGIVLLLGVYLARRVWLILYGKTFKRSAPLLHRRFVVIFSLAALTPAILVGSFSTSLISKNINDLFGENVRSTLDTAEVFLNEYVSEKFRELGIELQKAELFFETNRAAFENRISFTAFLQRYIRTLDADALMVIDREGRVYTRVWRTSAQEVEIPSNIILNYVDQQDSIAFLKKDENDYLMAVSQLDGYEGLYLVAGRFVAPNRGVLSSISGIDQASSALSKYDTDQERFRKTFFLTFIETALLILYAAISLGVLLANRIIQPLGHMVETAEKIRAGNLKARVNVKGDWGEISDLGSAFNRMTRQLSSQRQDLVREHGLSERRRQFSEAVLTGVRAGVIGLSEEGRITLMNASAERLLGRASKEILGFHIGEVLPEFAIAFNSARENVVGRTEDQITLETELGVRNFDLRVSSYEAGENDAGWVLTFDDMTRLVAAQRYSAWREVARRIAHEIKNPLTPILLSAERLKRKYSKDIKKDPEIFENCTDTIIRQVGSLEQMVNEFSSFARMPEPEFETHDFRTLIERVLFAQGVAFPDVKFELKDLTNGKEILVSCDERLISQALTNVYKNASESISERVDETGMDFPDGLIKTQLSVSGESLIIGITDNGKGWPMPDRHRLLEPYVTTRDTGTGLGLAIVKRIAEDHNGHLQLSERDDGNIGAHLEFTFPLTDAESQEAKPSKRKTKASIK
ncbi:MAG: HAMP domain-containing protein [Hellea sp.]|nr:HAMP domain-containing protein [Hellea sp.]